MLERYTPESISGFLDAVERNRLYPENIVGKNGAMKRLIRAEQDPDLCIMAQSIKDEKERKADQILAKEDEDWGRIKFLLHQRDCTTNEIAIELQMPYTRVAKLLKIYEQEVIEQLLYRGDRRAEKCYRAREGGQ